jgi:hypothetical protein
MVARVSDVPRISSSGKTSAKACRAPRASFFRSSHL